MDPSSSPTAVWKTQDDYSSGRGQETDCLKRTNWVELCAYASKLNNGIPCTLLPHVSFGGSNMARILQFNDEAKTRWVARVWMPGPDERPWQPEDAFRGEMNAMTVINDQLKDRSPIPKVYGYDLDPKNPVGSRFVLMEYIRGIIAMDLDGGWKVHGGRIPPQHKPHFFKSFARAHALLASVRLPKIGSLVRQDDGTITVGPLPPYGGPFDTAADFFKAWAETICQDLECGYRQDVSSNLNNKPDDVKSMMSFPYAVAAIAERLSASPYNEGPFPIRHRDFLHHNIIADTNYNVLAVIDWEHARTVPWEMFDFPDFIWRIPSVFSSRRNNKDVREVDEYVAMVAEAEKAENLDSHLSGILGDEKAQDIGYAVLNFWDSDGRARPYMEVLEPFRDPKRPFDLGPKEGGEAWALNGLWTILKDTLTW